MSEWRYFTSREVREARAWAVRGGIAVHENIWRSRGRRTCHLLAQDEATLIAAATTVGCGEWWIQRTRTLHFDLVGGCLERALARCRLPELSLHSVRRQLAPGKTEPPI